MATEIGVRLRSQIAGRAARRCEYCRIHEDDTGCAHQVDHIVSRKHRGATVSVNLAYACVLCNRFKGSDIASFDSESGELNRLFNPRTDNWDRHFYLAGPVIQPITDIARTTAHVLKLNAPERVEERRILQAIRRYPVR